MLPRIFLFGFWAACLSFSANAQISVGASIGANYSFWYWHNKSNNFNLDNTYDPSFGYRAAAVADWHISPLIGLRADIAYQIWRRSGTGTRFIFPYPYVVNSNVSERFHNWAGSLLANITPFRQKRIYFLAGATAASITEAWFTVTQEDSGAEPGFSRTTPIDLKYYNRTHVFADFGAGLKFHLGAKGSLFGEFRYQLPLTNLSEIDSYEASVNALLLNVGCLFKL